MIEACLRIVAPPHKRAEALDVLRSLKGPTETAIGCHGCHVLQDAEDRDALTYIVRWDTRDDLERHFRSERFRRLLPYIEMSARPPEVEIESVNSVGGIELLVQILGSG